MNRVIKKIIIILVCLLAMNIFAVTVSTDIVRVPIGSMIFGSSLLTDAHSYSGLTLTLTVGETVAFGDMVYMDWSDKEVRLAKADFSATVPVIGVALESKVDGEACLILILGYIRDDDWNFTATEVYLSDITAGGVLGVAPSDSGDQIQKLGFAYHANKMFFNPSIDIGVVK